MKAIIELWDSLWGKYSKESQFWAWMVVISGSLALVSLLNLLHVFFG